MSMAVAPFIPRTMPLVVGTRQIEAAERQFGRERVVTIEPPVDLDLNSPDLDVAPPTSVASGMSDPTRPPWWR